MKSELMIVKYTGGLLMDKIFWLALVGLCFIIAPGAWGNDDPANKEIQIFIERQVLIAFENGEEVYNFDIVTGRDGKETTAGSYSISRKYEKYTSKTYGSEMPYTMFFTEDGKAIHGTQMATLRSYLHSYLVESVGSEGCVGLTDDNALALFEWAPVGTPVVVIAEKGIKGDE
jgi:lipoprotein-anchoring transpeptidase ErfK/SrfK